MLMNKMWKIFESTGNVDAYLYYRECYNSLNKEKSGVLNITKEEKRA
ncbi:YqzL family protein [Proteiniborus sp. MB09-C3]|nr:YqzL family protein [Proteiniborus sp. MB09-C3]WIV10701.1 YqzL family protein [Proteiniborus sp. MB09-C3]